MAGGGECVEGRPPLPGNEEDVASVVARWALLCTCKYLHKHASEGMYTNVLIVESRGASWGARRGRVAVLDSEERQACRSVQWRMLTGKEITLTWVIFYTDEDMHALLRRKSRSLRF